jgi:hypothetical protein
MEAPVNEKNIKPGDFILLKIMNRWKKYEVSNVKDDWVYFKNPDGKEFVLNTKIHTHHMKYPKTKKTEKIKDEKKTKKKPARKKKNG